MGMPCEVNSILKLPPQSYPKELNLGSQYQVCKEGYRIIPIDVPILLVDENWTAHADIVIHKLTWEKNQTFIVFEIDRIYSQSFQVK
ncbi:DUF2584 family protein [Limnoraphis robusta]|uniref:DUF2584 family protein n=1 Tax=Limnoraphis robusta TaxID=1118279 RepID=UPI002B209F6D|nr:DUF2584 family protein [Limnoraphis robusta]MEA5496842.1 DUF2584 family protein [Limnoraphis robusta BA-68 BA1]